MLLPVILIVIIVIPLLFMGEVVGRLFREFAITLAVAIRDWMNGRDQQVSADAAIGSRDTIALVLSVLAAIAAVITTIWLIRTGHAGAESRWKLG